MALKQVGAIDTGFANAAGTQQNGGTADSTGLVNANWLSVTAMRSRLAAISAGTYTSSYLDKMTVNDMAYAIRLNDNPAAIFGK